MITLCAAASAFGGSATWSTSPVDGNWNSAFNCAPTIVVGNTSAGRATIIHKGSAFSGAVGGGRTDFEFGSTAANATLIANGGTGEAAGVGFYFLTILLSGRHGYRFGNGNLDISSHNAPGMAIDSIEGSGNVFLGANNLSAGRNGLSSVFSGVMQDGGFGHGTGGSLTKIGTGTLSLSGANTYTGNTNINAGVLRVDGSIASPNTFVNRGGTLSGTGTLGGDVSNEGIVAPGDSAGTLQVAGSYSQGGGGALEIEIASLLSFDGYTGHAGEYLHHSDQFWLERQLLTP